MVPYRAKAIDKIDSSKSIFIKIAKEPKGLATCRKPICCNIAYSRMQHNYHSHDSMGNWIAFLFGATFNIVTHVIETGPTSYFIHAIAGGIICLMFKMIGDLFAPLVRRIGFRITRWIEEKID